MEGKWPFIFITIVLSLLLAYVITDMEKTVIQNHWSERRCDLSVMVVAGLFKDDNDPRSFGDFTKDNFDFCVKPYVDKVLGVMLAPINVLFGKHLGVMSIAVGAMQSIRKIAQTVYSAFTKYIGGFYKQFSASIFQISRVVQYLRMAVNRISATAISTIYIGISMFRGMLNALQFTIKVILYICGILIALIIILWFVLFPVIPIVIAALIGVVALIKPLASVMSGPLESIMNDARNKMGGFCFADTTIIPVIKGNTIVLKPVHEIRVGDRLAYGYGDVTHVIEMDGSNVPLYALHGIHVSGSHLVKGVDGIWKSVADDERASTILTRSTRLYCFNTTTNQIPVYDEKGICIFRDWEEIDNEDLIGQYLWNYLVLSKLNNDIGYDKWKGDIKKCCDVSLMSKNTLIKTVDGYVPIHSLYIGYDKIVDNNGMPQTILGIVRGEVNNMNNTDIWHTEMYEYDNGIWRKGLSTVQPGVSQKVEGMSLITERGEFIMRSDKDILVRDFTEVGYDKICYTYSFVEERLRHHKV
jgi:hypothetical protein